MHLPQALHALPAQQPLPVDPQQLAQPVGVAPIGFLPRPSLRLNQQHLATAPAGQAFEQPIVEAADFHERHIAAVGSAALSQLAEIAFHGPPLGAHLPALDHRALLVSQIDGQLFAVLIDR